MVLKKKVFQYISVHFYGSLIIRKEHGIQCTITIVSGMLPEIHTVEKCDFHKPIIHSQMGGGRLERWCWVNFQCRGVLLIWIIVRQGPTALAVGAGGVVWTFFLSSIFSRFFLPFSGRRPDID